MYHSNTVIRTVGEIMKIVWTRTIDPSTDFIIATEIITKVGSVFVLLCVFRLLSYWIHSKGYYEQFPPPLLKEAIALGILIAASRRYCQSYIKRTAAGASVIYLGLTLINVPRARDPANSFVLLLFGVIVTVRAAYDVVAIAVPRTSGVVTSEMIQYLFDTVPEDLAVAVAIAYNLSKMAYKYETNLQQYNAINEMYVDNHNSRSSYNPYE